MRLTRWITLILLFALLISPVSALKITYTIEKDSFQYCDGNAKYLLKIQIASGQKISGVVKPYISYDGSSIKPCYPPYWERVFDVRNTGKDEVEFYFKNIPPQSTLHISVEYEGTVEEYSFLIIGKESPTTTIPQETTLKEEKGETNFFTIIDQQIWLFYQNYIPKLIKYEYFRGVLIATPILAILAFITLKSRQKREEKYHISIEDDWPTPRRFRVHDFKLYANCAYCGKREYMPFRCNYCGEYFCREHILPTKHNCPGLDAWKEKKPPGSGISWEYRTDGTYYRKY